MKDIYIRRAINKDITILFGWVNSEDSLKYKLDNKKVISYDEHKKWFLERLNDSGSYLWIIENFNKEAIGQIRFQKKENLYLDVDIYIIKDKRAKGLALKALNLSMKNLNNVILRAIVKKNNIISLNFFKKCGFILIEENSLKWVLTKNLGR